MRWDRLVRNPADLADPPPARRGDAPTMKTWTAPELRRFLAHVEGDRLYGAWVVAATTGMRRGEVLALRWRDVDLTLGRLSISQQVTTLGNRPVVSSPKTAKSRRLVALDPATVEALRLHRVAQAEERLLMGPAYRDEDLVFAWPDGRPIHPDLFSQWFDRHARPPDCRASACTIMRHTHATLALAAGIHPKIVSERLGHSTISITLDTYSRVSPGLQEEAAARVADLVFASATSWSSRGRSSASDEASRLPAGGWSSYVVTNWTASCCGRTPSPNFDVYGYYGISVFAEVGEATFEWIAVNKLARAEILLVFRARELVDAGLQLWDTGQAPHYDVVHEDMGELVERLLGCPHQVLTNPHWSDPEARR